MAIDTGLGVGIFIVDSWNLNLGIYLHLNSKCLMVAFSTASP
jgi:hypothetical protein